MHSENTASRTGQLQYPCRIDVKIFLKNQENNYEFVRDILLQTIASEHLLDIGRKLSRNGNYESFSCAINAQSKAQMDTLYEKLTGHPDVVMAI